MEALSNYDMAVKAACLGRNREAIAFALLAIVDEFRKARTRAHGTAQPGADDMTDDADPFGDERDDQGAAVSISADDPRHGTDNGYTNLGCRCDSCKAAKAARTKREREQRKSRPKPERVHGTEGGYVNWGCRCSRCRTAYSIAAKRYPRR